MVERLFESMLLKGKTALDTKSPEMDIKGARAIGFHVVVPTGVLGGVVALETSPVAGYAGTWKEISAITITTAGQVYSESIPESTDGLPSRFARIRIKEAIQAGEIDAYAFVQG